MSGIDTGKKGGDGGGGDGGKTTATTMCRRRVGQSGRGGGWGVHWGIRPCTSLSRQPKKKVKSVHFSDVAAADAWAFTEGEKTRPPLPLLNPLLPLALSAQSDLDNLLLAVKNRLNGKKDVYACTLHSGD